MSKEKEAKKKKNRRPRPIELYHCGVFVTVRSDEKMSNIWIGGAPVSLKDCKRLKDFLERFILSQER